MSISDETRARPGHAYWTWCEIRRLPVITIARRVKYAEVSCDMIVAPCRLDAEAMLAIDRLRTADRRGCYHDGEYHVGYAHLARIPIADAERIAKAIFDIAMDCIFRRGREAQCQ